MNWQKDYSNIGYFHKLLDRHNIAEWWDCNSDCRKAVALDKGPEDLKHSRR